MNFLTAVAILATLAACISAQFYGGPGNTVPCCGQNTITVFADTYQNVAILQRTVSIGIEADSGLNDSSVAVQNAIAILGRVNAILTSSKYTNVTNIQDVGISVNTRTNFTCNDQGFNCYSYTVGYAAVDTVSFNVPLGQVNNIITDLLTAGQGGVSIQNQQGYVDPLVFGDAQNAAVTRAASYAKYRAQLVVQALGGVKLGLPLSVLTNTNDYLSYGGGAIGSVYGSVNIVYNLVPSP